MYILIVAVPISQLWPVQPTGHLHWYEPWMLMHVPPLAQENCRHSLKSEIRRKHASLYLHVHVHIVNMLWHTGVHLPGCYMFMYVYGLSCMYNLSFRNFSRNYSNLVRPLGPKLEIKLLLLLSLCILSMNLVCNDEISKIFWIFEITCTWIL